MLSYRLINSIESFQQSLYAEDFIMKYLAKMSKVFHNVVENTFDPFSKLDILQPLEAWEMLKKNYIESLEQTKDIFSEIKPRDIFISLNSLGKATKKIFQDDAANENEYLTEFKVKLSNFLDAYENYLNEYGDRNISSFYCCKAAMELYNAITVTKTLLNQIKHNLYNPMYYP